MFRYGRGLGMIPGYFMVFPPVLPTKDLPDENELSDLSDNHMALNDANYFEVFAIDSGEKGSTLRHKQQIIIPVSLNSILSDAEDVPLSILGKTQKEEQLVHL